MPNAKKGGAAEETARAATTRRGSPTSATAGLSTGSNTSGTTGPSEQYTSPKDEEYVTKGCMYLLLDTVEDLSREMAELKALSMDQAKELVRNAIGHLKDDHPLSVFFSSRDRVD